MHWLLRVIGLEGLQLRVQFLVLTEAYLLLTRHP